MFYGIASCLGLGGHGLHTRGKGRLEFQLVAAGVFVFAAHENLGRCCFTLLGGAESFHHTTG